MNIDWHGIIKKTDTSWKYPYINTDTGTWWQWSEEKNAYVNTEINALGYTGDTGPQGDRGPKGDAGTSVFVTSITESSVDGGDNIITLSDGHILIVRNGSTGERGPAGRDGIDGLPGADGSTGPQGPKGDPGIPGAGVTVVDVSESDVDGGTNIVTFSDGTTLAVKNGNTGSQGPRGYQGQTGLPGKDGKDGQNYVITSADYQNIADLVDTMIADERQQALDDIDDAKTDAVGDVSAEGTTQVGLVAAKGQEVLESIPSDYSELSDDVSELKADFTHLENDKADIIVNSASGAIASFSDGANYPTKQCVFEMNPVQNLNGQEYPYPAGGGKNKLPQFAETEKFGVTMTPLDNGMFNFQGTVTVPGWLNFGETFTLAELGLAVGDTVIASSSIRIYGFFADDNGTNLLVFDTNGYPSRTIPSGATKATIYIYAKSTLPTVGEVINVTAWFQLEKGSTATSYAPYSNICPISGHTEVDAVRTGVNVWDEEWEIGGIANADGQKYTDANRIRSKNYIPVIPNTAYYFYMPSNYLPFKLAFYEADKSFISYRTIKNQTFVTPQNCHYLMFAENATDYGTTYNRDISINYPSTDHDYHAYSGQSVTYQLGQTVYAGTLTINEDGTGQIVSKWKGVVFDGTENWSAYATFANHYQVAVGDNKPNVIGTEKNATSNMYQAWIGYSSPLDEVTQAVFSADGGRIRFKNVNIATLSDWTASLAELYASGTPLQCVYKLNTPIVTNLTEQEVITMLKGTNNVWHDANGDTEVTYRADTKLYIDNKFAELQTLIANS